MTQDTLFEAALDLLQIPSLVHRGVRRAIATDPSIHMDIRPQQHEALALLDKEGAQKIADMGKKLQIAKAQMTQLLGKLSKQGFIDRTTSPTDRRVTHISITLQGKNILELNQNKLVDMMRGLMSGLSETDLVELSKSLKHIRDTMEQIDRLASGSPSVSHIKLETI